MSRRELWISLINTPSGPTWQVSPSKFDDAYHLREVDPAYDAVVQGLVEALNVIHQDGQFRNHDCHETANEALEAWERVNEGKP